MSEGPGASEPPALAVGSCVAGKTHLSADRLPAGLLAQAPPVGLSGGGTGRSLSFNPLPLPSPSIGYSERLLVVVFHAPFWFFCDLQIPRGGEGHTDCKTGERATAPVSFVFPCLPVSPNRKAHGPSRLSHAVSTSTGSAFIFFICTDFAVTRPWVLVPMLKTCFLIELLLSDWPWTELLSWLSPYCVFQPLVLALFPQYIAKNILVSLSGTFKCFLWEFFVNHQIRCRHQMSLLETWVGGIRLCAVLVPQTVFLMHALSVMFLFWYSRLRLKMWTAVLSIIFRCYS